MRRWYLRRAIPWAAVLTCCGLAVLAWSAVHRWPATGLVLLPLMLACCAAACGFVFDEPATAVTSVTPRGGAWARTARLAVAGVPLAVLVLLVAATPSELPLDRPAWLLAGLGAALPAAGTAAICARRQLPRPGPTVAGAVVLLALAPAVVGPFLDWESVYPYVGSPGWVPALWAGLVVLGAGAVAIASTPAVRR